MSVSFKQKYAGISLIEAVITLLFITITVILVSHFIKRTPTTLDKQQSKARQELRLLENAVGAFTIDLERSAPTNDEGIAILVKEGYLSKVLIDPWGNQYQYRNPGIYDNIDYWSQGPDGKDSDDDIVGWDAYGSYVR